MWHSPPWYVYRGYLTAPASHRPPPYSSPILDVWEAKAWGTEEEQQDPLPLKHFVRALLNRRGAKAGMGICPVLSRWREAA